MGETTGYATGFTLTGFGLAAKSISWKGRWIVLRMVKSSLNKCFGKYYIITTAAAA